MRGSPLDKAPWMAHYGGKCPVTRNIPIDIRLRSGEEDGGEYSASAYYWDHRGTAGDIVAWRYSEPSVPKLTGGSSPYYSVRIGSPTGDRDAYTAECNDIIEALGMNFAEGNVFKAVWRMAAQRLGNGKPGTTAKYDAEKIAWFGNRLVEQCK